MNIKLEESWKVQLQDELEKTYFQRLINFVKNEYTEGVCYPPIPMIFNAFNRCSFAQTKIVILGQDPYHGPQQANGLCFSVNDGINQPPSLKNIFKEIKKDLGIAVPKSGNLERWADQGVLLLNATLTVRQNEAGSHQKQGWEEFTDAVISKLNSQKENLVFLLWGSFAHKKVKYIDTKKHFVLKSKHPSPLSANQGGWFDQHHFSKTNDFLKSKGLSEINW